MPTITREQALDDFGDLQCRLVAFRNGAIVTESDDDVDGCGWVRITLPAGSYDPETASYDQSDVWTMREDESRCRVTIYLGNEIVYDAEPRGIEFTVDDEDPDGDV